MPILVSATGQAGLPSTQAEIDALRAARLAKRLPQKASIKKKRNPRKSLTDGMSNAADKVW